MGEFDFEKLDREVDDLLADVKGLLDEPEEDEAELDDLEEDETEPEDAEDDAESGEAEDAVSDDRTIIFKPLTAYEQSKAEYQTAKRAEYERARAQERQNRLAEQQRREAEEDRVLRQMEDRRKKRRTREAPDRPGGVFRVALSAGRGPRDAAPARDDGRARGAGARPRAEAERKNAEEKGRRGMAHFAGAGDFAGARRGILPFRLGEAAEVGRRRTRRAEEGLLDDPHRGHGRGRIPDGHDDALLGRPRGEDDEPRFHPARHAGLL